MKKINPYVLGSTLSLLILLGLGAFSIAPLFLAVIGVFWLIPLLRTTTKKYFFLTLFIIIATLVVRTFLFQDFIGTLLLIPYGMGGIAILWSRLFNKKNTKKKELTIGLVVGLISLLGVLFYLTIILGFFHPLYFRFQLEQILRHNLTQQGNFLRTYLGEGNILDKIEMLAYYMSQLQIGILSGVMLLGITFMWHLGAKKDNRIPFPQWQGNYMIIWGLIIGLLFLIVGLGAHSMEITFVGINILIIYSLFLFILGVSALMDVAKKFSFGVLIIAGVLFFLAPPTLILSLGVGFINCFSNTNILRRTLK